LLFRKGGGGGEIQQCEGFNYGKDSLILLNALVMKWFKCTLIGNLIGFMHLFDVSDDGT
jgi:hypothetical protein